jgi:hypothetical protein
LISRRKRSAGERIAHQVLDGDDEPRGQDWRRAFDGEGAGLGCRWDQILGETAERGIDAQCSADRPEQRIERSFTTTIGIARQVGLDLDPMALELGARVQRDVGLAGIAVAEDDEALGRHALGQHLVAADDSDEMRPKDSS